MKDVTMVDVLVDWSVVSWAGLKVYVLAVQRAASRAAWWVCSWAGARAGPWAGQMAGQMAASRAASRAVLLDAQRAV